MNKDHEFYMHRCVALGIQAGHRGDSPVGSVIVKDGHVIAEGIIDSAYEKGDVLEAVLEKKKVVVHVRAETS